MELKHLFVIFCSAFLLVDALEVVPQRLETEEDFENLYGIETKNIHPDIIQDAFMTTVSLISKKYLEFNVI